MRSLWRLARPGLASDSLDSPTKLKVTSRIGQAITDEIQTTVDDPRQPKLL